MSMRTTKKTLIATLIMASLAWAHNVPAAEAAAAESAIHIDIPVNIKQANVVFNMARLSFAGDMPVGMKYMDLLAKRFKQMGTEGKIVGVFHADSAYMTLNDESYNKARHVSTGNPYKKLIADLIAEGVQIEECAVSMKSNNWTNKDLLPGVKVNTGAIGRLIQLTQEGYVQIQP